MQDFADNKEKFRKQLLKVVKTALEQNSVFQSIAGANEGKQDGSNLPAEFGLAHTTAIQAAKLIQKRIGESVLINADNKGRKTIIVFEVKLENDYKKKFDDFPFTYESENGYEIDWMAFLLEAANRAIGGFIEDVQNYGIKYGDFKASNSGGAIMTKNANFADRFPYSINKKFVAFTGDNFIEEALSSEEFQQQIANILENFIDEVF